jgi:murein DD-endopeptidase MepM/ murein hydrolase activator NlpD
MRGMASILLAVLLIGACGVLWWRCEGQPPAVEAPAALEIGRTPKTVTVAVSDPRSGLRSVAAVVRQGDKQADLPGAAYEGGLAMGGPTKAPVTLELPLDARALALKEGEATLEIAARDWSWRGWLSGNENRVAIPVKVDLTPPRLGVETGLSYVARGGTGAVAYSLSEAVTRDGVDVAGVFFPGFPAPGSGATAEGPKQGRRVALYAIHRDAPQNPKIQVVAEDAAGNRAAATWPVQFQERKFEEDRIDLPPKFLEQKVPELAAAVGVTLEEPVAAFQEINSKVRAADEKRVRDALAKTAAQPLWTGPFIQWANSQVTSRFAEHRTYFVGETQVSEAIHYGYDLATLAGAPVTASNAGTVVFASDLGIYGNCVILDHGLGLASLYGHLASFDVSEGQSVPKGAVLGRSGATGLAGGDHLHFAILVGGTYVEPKEWWDPKWVREKVDSQLAPPAPPPATADPGAPTVAP